MINKTVAVTCEMKEVAALTAELARVTAERDDSDLECGAYIGMLDRAQDNLAAALAVTPVAK